MRLLHYSDKPFELNLRRRYREDLPRDHKPKGLWVSVEGEDDWPSWCKAENFNLEGLAVAYEVRLRPEANILLLDTVEKLDAFHALYGSQDRFEYRAVDWRTVKSAHDGIIIAPYHWQRRLGHMSWYYTWDCASGVLWNLTAIAGFNALEPTDIQRSTGDSSG